MPDFDSPELCYHDSYEEDEADWVAAELDQRPRKDIEVRERALADPYAPPMPEEPYLERFWNSEDDSQLAQDDDWLERYRRLVNRPVHLRRCCCLWSRYIFEYNHQRRRELASQSWKHGTAGRRQYMRHKARRCAGTLPWSAKAAHGLEIATLAARYEEALRRWQGLWLNLNF